MTRDEKYDKVFTEQDMKKSHTECDNDRVKSGWKNVVNPTLDRLDLSLRDLMMIDVGCGTGRKSLKKYAFDDKHLRIPGYSAVPSNMAGIEGDKTRLAQLKINVPGVEAFLFDFSKNGLKGLDIQKKYHVVLLCEVLEHLHLGEGQTHLLRDSAELVQPGGGMHVTFPRKTQLDDPNKKPWGHKCTKVPCHDVMNMLVALFEDVTWAQSEGGTVNFFALGRKPHVGTWSSLLNKYVK
jgi:2-polyprenyl-3-methyl-5-hydroxy-6-metoxy-1,4-benzoquinol methylase